MVDINTEFRSPNFGDRGGARVDMIVIHYTAMDTAAALARLCDPQSSVSAHYVIAQTGQVYRLVDEDKRAWHAGVAHWSGVDDVNTCSIGIELDHMGIDADGDFIDYAEPQIQSLIALLTDLCERYEIPPHRVVGHSDVAPERKQDPGNRFPWRRLADVGLAFWPEMLDLDKAGSAAPEPAVLARGDVGENVRDLQKSLAGFGYGIKCDGVFGPKTEACVIAFQRRFRPAQSDGRADMQTCELLDAGLRTLPLPVDLGASLR